MFLFQQLRSIRATKQAKPIELPNTIIEMYAKRLY